MLVPWLHFHDTFNSLDELFRHVDPGFGRSVSAASTRSPDLVETDDAWVYSADLPGVAPEDLEVTARPGRVSLAAERKVETPEGFEGHRRERRGWTFSKTLQVPPHIDLDGVTADLKNGVLTLTLPKSPAAQPRLVPVNAS